MLFAKSLHCSQDVFLVAIAQAASRFALNVGVGGVQAKPAALSQSVKRM
jgi:hypothetical protein